MGDLRVIDVVGEIVVEVCSAVRIDPNGFDSAIQTIRIRAHAEVVSKPIAQRPTGAGIRTVSC